MRLSLALAPLLLIAAPALAQDKLPPAQALVPDDETAAVLAPVRALFAGLVTRDREAIRAHVTPGATMTIAGPGRDGTPSVQQLSFAEWLAALEPGTERWEERMDNPAVEIDGDLAMVWGFYTFRIDGKLSHCGADLFTLVREGGKWKIAGLAFSMRNGGCGT